MKFFLAFIAFCHFIGLSLAAHAQTTAPTTDAWQYQLAEYGIKILGLVLTTALSVACAFVARKYHLDAQSGLMNVASTIAVRGIHYVEEQADKAATAKLKPLTSDEKINMAAKYFIDQSEAHGLPTKGIDAVKALIESHLPAERANVADAKSTTNGNRNPTPSS